MVSPANQAFTLRAPGIMDRLRSRVLYLESYRNARLIPRLEPRDVAQLEELRDTGSIALEGFVAPDKLSVMQAEFAAALHALEFEMPCLAQTRVDPVRHADLIESQMYGSNAALEARGVTFSRAEARSYDQVVADFKPSTLTAYMLEHSAAYREVWLDPRLLGLVSNYLGMVPKLSEAYVRRNFPAPFLTMNHYWHRDLNTPFHLLKAFIFLSDCDLTTGPHEFILESHRDFKTLNGKRYFGDEEVDRVVPPGHPRRLMSVVKAGTVILEDTRGLHRARMPDAGTRDLGYAVYTPLRPFYPYQNYRLPRAALDGLSPLQRAFVPQSCVV
jgi:hypothetical protein